MSIYEKVKSMDKMEFDNFIHKIQSGNHRICAKCGEVTLDRITISVAKDNYSNRKLCNMCKNCYSDMLDYLAVSDIVD